VDRPSLASFRQALAGNLLTYLSPAPAKDAGPDVELAEALAQGLTGADPASPDKLSEPAGLMLKLLTNADSNLIKVTDAVSAPADAIVILTSSEIKNQTLSPASQGVVAAHVAIASAAQARSEGVVVASVNSMSGDLAATILADGDLAKTVSTVTGPASRRARVHPGWRSLPHRRRGRALRLR